MGVVFPWSHVIWSYHWSWGFSYQNNRIAVFSFVILRVSIMPLNCIWNNNTLLFSMFCSFVLHWLDMLLQRELSRLHLDRESPWHYVSLTQLISISIHLYPSQEIILHCTSRSRQICCHRDCLWQISCWFNWNCCKRRFGGCSGCSFQGSHICQLRCWVCVHPYIIAYVSSVISVSFFCLTW